MKLYQCSILILVFCLLLCSACSSNTGEETPTHSSQTVSATDTDVIPKGETANNGKVSQSENNQLIEDAYSGSYQTDNGIQHSYSIPKINLSSDSIDKLNEEIYQCFYTDRIGTNGYPSMSGTTYQWMQNDSLLTLIICDDAGYEYSEEYTVYCIDISEKRVLSTDEILQRAGMTHETFTTLAKEALGNTFASWLSSYIAEVGTDDAFLRECFQETISDDNISSAVVYVGADGMLHFCATIYQPAGADRHQELISLEDFDTSEYYEALMKQN